MNLVRFFHSNSELSSDTLTDVQRRVWIVPHSLNEDSKVGLLDFINDHLWWADIQGAQNHKPGRFYSLKARISRMLLELLLVL
jgi:hypothetical protein